MTTLSPFLQHNTLEVKRLNKWKLMSLGDSVHDYEVRSNGELVGTIREKPGPKLHRILHDNERSYTIEVYDTANQLVMVVKKANDRVSVELAGENAEKVGFCTKVWHLTRRQYNLSREHEAAPFACIDEKSQLDVFQVQSQGQVVATITAKPPGSWRSLEVNYRVEFADAEYDVRALVLGCQIAIDFDYYTGRD